MDNARSEKIRRAKSVATAELIAATEAATLRREFHRKKKAALLSVLSPEMLKGYRQSEPPKRWPFINYWLCRSDWVRRGRYWVLKGHRLLRDKRFVKAGILDDPRIPNKVSAVR